MGATDVLLLETVEWPTNSLFGDFLSVLKAVERLVVVMLTSR